MAGRAPDALICDMAETYHVLDWRALGLPLAATLAAGLRENSRTQMQLAGVTVSADTLLLAAMTDQLQLLVWAKTKDGQKGRSRPASVMQTLLNGDAARKNSGFASGAEYEAARVRILRGNAPER